MLPWKVLPWKVRQWSQLRARPLPMAAIGGKLRIIASRHKGNKSNCKFRASWLVLCCCCLSQEKGRLSFVKEKIIAVVGGPCGQRRRQSVRHRLTLHVSPEKPHQTIAYWLVAVCLCVCAALSSHTLHSHLDAHDATLLRRTNISLSLASDGSLSDLSPQTALRHTSLDELAWTETTKS